MNSIDKKKLHLSHIPNGRKIKKYIVTTYVYDPLNKIVFSKEKKMIHHGHINCDV